VIGQWAEGCEQMELKTWLKDLLPGANIREMEKASSSTVKKKKILGTLRDVNKSFSR